MTETDNKYNEILIKTFKAFDSFCKKHNIKYFAAYGTCLGAIRHHGIIPWDDDIDVMMPRSDYNRLLSLKSELNGTGYEIIDSSLPYYTQPFLKFSDANTTMLELKEFPIVFGVYIDVFPLDDVDNVDDARKLSALKLKVFDRYRNGIRKMNLRHILSLLGHGHIKTLIREGVYGALGTFFSDKLYQKYLDVEAVIQKEKGNNCMYYGGFYRFEKELIDKSWLGAGTEVPFEDTMINVPSNYDAYLSNLYNDYMTPPPPEMRYTHHTRYYTNLEERMDAKTIFKKGLRDKTKVVGLYGE